MELHLELGGEGIQGSWSGGCAGGLTSTENLLQLQRQGAQWDFTPGTWALLDKKNLPTVTGVQEPKAGSLPTLKVVELTPQVMCLAVVKTSTSGRRVDTFEHLGVYT